MVHVINSLKQWLETYEQDNGEDRDEKAIICIKNALKELGKYYGR